VRSLGADRVIDYATTDVAKAVSGCDVVFDTVGGAARAGCYTVLKPGGRLVWIAPAPEGFTPPRADVETLRPRVARDRAHLERRLALHAAGAVWPPAITRYKLADAAAAHRVSEARHLQARPRGALSRLSPGAEGAAATPRSPRGCRGAPAPGRA